MWIAIMFGSLIVGGVAAYVTFAVHAVARGAPAWALAVGLPLVYLAVPFVFTCIWITLGWWYRAERPADVALTWRQRLRLFANEFASLAQSPLKMALYGVLMRDPAPAPATLPVLLVHGIGCNAGVWTGFRRYLEWRKLGPVYALSYDPPLASIEHFADQLAARIDEVRAATGAEQVLVVGHSMGGLVARSYLRKYGGKHMRELITLGTPHSGSMHAWLMSGVAMAEMRPSSPFLTALNADVEHGAGVPVVSLWSWHDSMVTPQTSSRLDWADNIVIAGVAHNALLSDREVWKTVADEVAKARG